MKLRKTKKDSATATPESVIPPRPHTHGEEVGAIGGEVVGGVVGSMAGPAGAVAGMVLGAVAGAMAGKIMDEEAERKSYHDEALDEVIGVTKGPLGAVQPREKMQQRPVADARPEGGVK
jgi:outer membrane lipoprotein SlyB